MARLLIAAVRDEEAFVGHDSCFSLDDWRTSTMTHDKPQISSLFALAIEHQVGELW